MRVERQARPVLGKADVARNYRRNVTRFKKKVREKKEREREREEEGEARRFETILSNGRRRSHGLSTLYTR